MNTINERCEICKFYEPPKKEKLGTCTNPNVKGEGGFGPSSLWPKVRPEGWCGGFTPMYKDLIGKRVQITMLEDGQKVVWPVRKLVAVEGSLLMLDSGEEIDTASPAFVKLRPEPPMPQVF